MNTTKPNNPPAFPLAMPDQYHPQGAPLGKGFVESGMSLRDWFAGMALQGLLSAPRLIKDNAHYEVLSYEMADAMLAEREKGNQ